MMEIVWCAAQFGATEFAHPAGATHSPRLPHPSQISLFFGARLAKGVLCVRVQRRRVERRSRWIFSGHTWPWYYRHP